MSVIIAEFVTQCYKVAEGTSCSAPASRLEAELLADQAGDLAAVRAALRRAHDDADDRADGPPLPRLDLLGGVRLRGDRPLDDLGELLPATPGLEAEPLRHIG